MHWQQLKRKLSHRLVSPICNFKKQTPCIVNKICNEEAVTDEEIEEAYKKMLEDKNKKCQEI